MKEQIIEKLNQLSEAEAQLAVLRLDKQEAINSVLSPEIKAALAAIDLEMSPMFEAVEATITALTAVVKALVVEAGESVKGDHLHAVYAKGRESWDGKSLSGYAAAHPEILTFRKIGDPSVSIRKL
jgi:hypothetical protein